MKAGLPECPFFISGGKGKREGSGPRIIVEEKEERLVSKERNSRLQLPKGTDRQRKWGKIFLFLTEKKRGGKQKKKKKKDQGEEKNRRKKKGGRKKKQIPIHLRRGEFITRSG